MGWSHLLLGFAALVVGMFLPAANASNPYQANVTVIDPPASPETNILVFSDLNQTTQAFSSGAWLTLFPGYTNASAATADVTLRGIPIIVSFTHGSSTAVLRIPSLKITRSFTDLTRPASGVALIAYLKTNLNSIVDKVAPLTPIDPVAGNPTSLTSRMMDRQFLAATGIGGFFSDIPSPGAASASATTVPNAFTVGGDYEHASSDGFSIDAFTLPLDYTVFFADPRYSVNLDLPLSYVNIAGANVAQASFAATFRFPAPMIRNWYLSVGIRGGLTGSAALAEGDFAYSGTVSSLYNIYFGDYRFGIGNAIGVVKTAPLSVGSFTTGPKLTNYPIINGADLEGSLPFTMFDYPASFEAYVVDTYFAGDRLYMQHWDEVGLNIGTRRRPGQQSWQNFRIGLDGVFGANFKMIGLRGSYRF